MSSRISYWDSLQATQQLPGPRLFRAFELIDLLVMRISQPSRAANKEQPEIEPARQPILPGWIRPQPSDGEASDASSRNGTRVKYGQ